MNIKHAHSIPLADILHKLGYEPQKRTSRNTRYFSPFREETIPSFFVYEQTNSWYDFGAQIGGDGIALVCAWLKSQNKNYSVRDALRWLSGMAHHAPATPAVRKETQKKQERALVLKGVQKLQRRALLHYLEQRGIPGEIAMRYLREIWVYNPESGTTYFGLGMKNEEGGYEFRNPMMKSSVGAKSISFIRGSVPKPAIIHLFEGMMDFLSVIAFRKGAPLKGDAIILNSLATIKQAIPYIKNYGYRTAYTWLDNDPAGLKATGELAAFFQTEPALKHILQNNFYAPHKDVNAWYMHTLGLDME
jgi:Toprim-like